MKRFKFTLQSVQDVRDNLRTAAERRLGEAQKKVEEAERLVSHLTELREQERGAYITALECPQINTAEISMRVNYLGWLDQACIEARSRLASAERERDAKRADAVEAARDSEAIAKLHDRQSARHTAEIIALEQKTLDDLATIAAVHKTQEAI